MGEELGAEAGKMGWFLESNWRLLTGNSPNYVGILDQAPSSWLKQRGVYRQTADNQVAEAIRYVIK